MKRTDHEMIDDVAKIIGTSLLDSGEYGTTEFRRETAQLRAHDFHYTVSKVEAKALLALKMSKAALREPNPNRKTVTQSRAAWGCGQCAWDLCKAQCHCVTTWFSLRMELFLSVGSFKPVAPGEKNYQMIST